MLDPTPLLKLWATWRRRALDRQDPADAQRSTLARLLRSGRRTDFGRAHGFASIRTVEDYRRRVPLRSYEALRLGRAASLEVSQARLAVIGKAWR